MSKNRIIAVIIISSLILLTPRIVLADSEADETICESWPVSIIGTSLSPLILEGERITMRRAACAGEVARGDLAIFRTGALERPVIKIIKAVPGDVFFVDEQGLLSVNGEVLKNSAGVDYTLPPEKMRMIELYETELGGVIPPGTYLMLGDNPRGGLDSSQIGLVDRKDIIMFGPAPSKTPSVSQTPRP